MHTVLDDLWGWMDRIEDARLRSAAGWREAAIGVLSQLIEIPMRSLAADPRGYTVWLRASSLASHLAVAAGPPSEALERALDTLTRQRWPQVAETRGAASSVLGLRVREGRRAR